MKTNINKYLVYVKHVDDWVKRCVQVIEEVDHL